MTLKETYEEMSDEELLKKFKHFQRYRDESKLIMLEELRKRKLVGEEEIEKKLKRIEEPENQNNMNNPNEKISEQQTKLPIVQASLLSRGLILFLAMGLGLINLSTITFISGISTLSWKESKAQILNISKEVVTRHKEEVIYHYLFLYKYTVDGIEYTNSRAEPYKADDQAAIGKLAHKYKEGDYIKIIYNPKNPSKSLVYRYSLKELWGFPFGLFLILLFHLSVKKAERDYGIENSKKSMVITYVFCEVLIIFLELATFLK